MPSLSSLQLDALVDSQTQGDPDLAATVKKLIRTENYEKTTFDTEQVSPVGAIGVGQVMPKTREGLIKTGFLPANNDSTSAFGQVQAAVAVVKDMKSRGLTPAEIPVAYNGGNAALADFRAGAPLNPETTDYVKKFNGTAGAPKMATNTRSSTTSKLLPEGAEEDLRTTQERNSGIFNGLMRQVADFSSQFLTDSKNAVNATKAEGDAAAQQAQVAGLTQSAALDNSNRILSQYGINLNDGAPEIKTNYAAQLQAEHEQLPAAQELARLQSTSMVDDPIGWFVNNIKAIPLVSKVNALQTVRDTAANNIDSAMRRAALDASIQPGDMGDIIKAKTFADVTAAKAKAEADAQKQSLVAKQFVASHMLNIAQLAQADQASRVQLYKVLTDTRTMSEGTSAESRKLQDQQDKVAPINLWLAANVPDQKPINYQQFTSLPPELRGSLDKLSIFGTMGSVGETVAALNQMGGSNLVRSVIKSSPDKGKVLGDAIEGGQKAYQDALTIAMKPGAAPDPNFKLAKTDQEQLQYGIDMWQKKMEKEFDGGDMATASTTNPYRFRPGRAALSHALADNGTAQFVTKQALTNNATPVTDEALFQSADGRIAAGEPAAKVAEDLARFYREGLQMQYSNSSLNSLGFKSPQSYPLRLSSGFGTIKVDAIDPSSVLNNLVARRAASSSANAINSGRMFD